MKNEKIKKTLKLAGIVLGAFLLLALALDSLIMPFFVSSDIITVPNVVNKHKDEAVKILEALNLNPVLLPPRFDERTKKDFIFLQRPESGAMVKTGRRVYITVSGGDEKVKIPNLYGKSAKEAQLLLENAGLKIGFVEQVESEEPQNTVVSQQYPPNVSMDKGTIVNISTSMGPAEGMIRTPKLIGKSLKDAEYYLEKSGLRLGKLEYRSAPGLLPNTVIEQSPSEDALISNEGSVDLVISSTSKNNERKNP